MPPASSPTLASIAIVNPSSVSVMLLTPPSICEIVTRQSSDLRRSPPSLRVNFTEIVSGAVGAEKLSSRLVRFNKASQVLPRSKAVSVWSCSCFIRSKCCCTISGTLPLLFFTTSIIRPSRSKSCANLGTDGQISPRGCFLPSYSTSPLARIVISFPGIRYFASSIPPYLLLKYCLYFSGSHSPDKYDANANKCASSKDIGCSDSLPSNLFDSDSIIL